MYKLIQRLSDKWANYRLERAKKIVEKSGIYRNLEFEVERLRVVDEIRTTDIEKFSGEFTRILDEYSRYKDEVLRSNHENDVKLREKESKISELERRIEFQGGMIEQTLSERVREDLEWKKREEEMLAKIKSGEEAISEYEKLKIFKREAKRFLSRYKDLSLDFDECVRALRLKYEGDLERKTLELQWGADEDVRKGKKEFLESIDGIAQSYQALFNDVLRGVNETTAIRSRLILKFYEENPSFGKSNCLVLDSRMNPFYATQGFYKFFEMQPGSDLEDFPLKKEIVAQSLDRPKSVGRKTLTTKWQNREKERTVGIDLDIKYVSSEAGNDLGVVIEYKAHQGTFGKLLFGSKKHAVDDLTKFLEPEKIPEKNKDESTPEQS